MLKNQEAATDGTKKQVIKTLNKIAKFHDATISGKMYVTILVGQIDGGSDANIAYWDSIIESITEFKHYKNCFSFGKLSVVVNFDFKD